MQKFEPTTIAGKVYADRELRKIYRENLERRRQEIAEAEAEAERRRERGPERLKAFFQELGVPLPASLFEKPDQRELTRRRLLAMPAAEAWAQQHPEHFNDHNLPPGANLLDHARMERLRLKAACRRFREMGVR